VDTIQTFIDKTPKIPEVTQYGEFSDWLPWCVLNLKGHALQFVALRVLGLREKNSEECHEIAARPGQYQIQCKGVRFGGSVRIAGMRAIPIGINEACRGEKLGIIGIDIGGIAVLDIDMVETSFGEDEDKYMAWLEDLLYKKSEAPVEIYNWNDTNTEIPHVETGFGDGGYEVYELLSNTSEVIGLEIVFIEQEEEYPFVDWSKVEG